MAVYLKCIPWLENKTLREELEWITQLYLSFLDLNNAKDDSHLAQWSLLHLYGELLRDMTLLTKKEIGKKIVSLLLRPTNRLAALFWKGSSSDLNTEKKLKACIDVIKLTVQKPEVFLETHHKRFEFLFKKHLFLDIQDLANGRHTLTEEEADLEISKLKKETAYARSLLDKMPKHAQDRELVAKFNQERERPVRRLKTNQEIKQAEEQKKIRIEMQKKEEQRVQAELQKQYKQYSVSSQLKQKKNKSKSLLAISSTPLETKENTSNCSTPTKLKFENKAETKHTKSLAPLSIHLIAQEEKYYDKFKALQNNTIPFRTTHYLKKWMSTNNLAEEVRIVFGYKYQQLIDDKFLLTQLARHAFPLEIDRLIQLSDEHCYLDTQSSSKLVLGCLHYADGHKEYGAFHYVFLTQKLTAGDVKIATHRYFKTVSEKGTLFPLPSCILNSIEYCAEQKFADNCNNNSKYYDMPNTMNPVRIFESGEIVIKDQKNLSTITLFPLSLFETLL